MKYLSVQAISSFGNNLYSRYDILHRVIVTGLVVLLLSFFDVRLAQSQSPDALKWVPESSNALAVVRVRQLIASPVGQREGWAKEHQSDYASGTVALPPGVDVAVRATHVGTNDAESFSLFQIPKGVNINLQQLSQHENGELESLAGVSIFLSSRNSYFARLSPELIGVQQPANRQSLARWLRFGRENKQPVLSKYLADAATQDTTSQVIIAVDLQEMLDPKSTHNWLAQSVKLKESPQNVAALDKLFTTFRGVRITLQAKDKLQGRFILDFDAAPGPEGKLLKEPVLEHLADMGATLESVVDATIKVEGKSVVLENDLGTDGLRRVLSLIRTPSPAGFSGNAANTGKVEPNVIGSEHYFHNVKHALEDLSRKNKQASDYNKTAVWHENYAHQIEQLPTLGVDPALLEWGARVNARLLALAQSLRGVPVEVNNLNRSITLNTETNYYKYATTPYQNLYRPGRVSVNSNVAEVRMKQADAVARGADDRTAIWQQLTDDMAGIQRQMAEKYGPDFGKAKR